MATGARDERRGGRRGWDRNRAPYRLTARQVLAMRDQGLLPDGVDLELWDGRLYRMTKHEPHNYAVSVAAEALRRLMPDGYHIREEKSSRDGDHTLPEPDVAVARGLLRDYIRELPTLDRFALIVEVCDSTRHADFSVKPRRYARAGVPAYWVIDLKKRQVVVFGDPKPIGRGHAYGARVALGPGESVEVLIDGQSRGRVAVDDLLPPPDQGPES